MKAKDRSRRNSPPKPTKTEAKAERKQKTRNRKMRQASRRTLGGMPKVTQAMSNLDMAAVAAGAATKTLLKMEQERREQEEKRRIVLEGMNKTKLVSMAREMGLKRYTLMDKAMLIDAIVQAEL